MSKYHISDETKFMEGRCMRLGKYWVAWIKVNEFSSLGTRCILIDWKTGRQVQCLSLGERAFYLINRWDDDILDINEQVVLYKDSSPLIKGTTEIAEELGVKAIAYGKKCTTSDFRIFYSDGSVKVFSFKSSEDEVFAPKNVRLRQRLAIEKAYWESQSPSVPWELAYRSEVNFTLADNIAMVTRFYDRKKVFDDVSYLKHLIATKQVTVDMESEILNFGEMVKNGI